MRLAGADRHGLRVRAVIAVLWRAGLRISEALALSETDVDPARGSVLIGHGTGETRREVGIDDGGCEHVNRWLEPRVLPCGRSAVLLHRWPHPRPRVASHRRPGGNCESSPPRRMFAAGSRRTS